MLAHLIAAHRIACELAARAKSTCGEDEMFSALFTVARDIELYVESNFPERAQDFVGTRAFWLPEVPADKAPALI